jgi:hypothetical protein
VIHLPRRPRIAFFAVAVLTALVLACDRGDPPPSNPLDESRATGTAAPIPTGPAVFPPSPGASTTSTPGASVTTTPTSDAASEAAREKAAARAIDAIAEWLGVPRTEFTIARIEVVAWPNACLGVERPDRACAQVVTPGERVVLRHRSGGTYEVHLGPRDAAAWHPRYEATRTIASVDLSTGILTLQAVSGSDEMGTRHRTAPGSFVGGIKDLKAGDRVQIAVAPWPAANAGVGAIVWIVRTQ